MWHSRSFRALEDFDWDITQFIRARKTMEDVRVDVPVEEHGACNVADWSVKYDVAENTSCY